MSMSAADGYTRTAVEKALARPNFDPVPHLEQMAPSDRSLDPPDQAMNLGAVLLLLYRHHGRLCLVLGQRPHTMRHHPGQIAFPGGRHDPPETLAETALRETHEEIGVPPADIDLLGRLHALYIPPSNFYVHPFVGWHHGRPTFVPSPHEIARIVEVPVRHFQADAHRAVETRHFNGRPFRIPYYRFDDDKIWGATATMISELAARLRPAAATES